jgi:hypothetical protein
VKQRHRERESENKKARIKATMLGQLTARQSNMFKERKRERVR